MFLSTPQSEEFRHPELWWRRSSAERQNSSWYCSATSNQDGIFHPTLPSHLWLGCGVTCSGGKPRITTRGLRWVLNKSLHPFCFKAAASCLIPFIYYTCQTLQTSCRKWTGLNLQVHRTESYESAKSLGSFRLNENLKSALHIKSYYFSGIWFETKLTSCLWI